MAKQPKGNRADVEQAFSNAWGEIREFVAYELNGESAEGVVLAPLGQHTLAASAIAGAEMEGDDFYCRAVGALIPGYVREADPDLLRWVWMTECKRRKRTKDELELAGCNSVAERVLISATRWLRVPRLRETGMEVLVDMVERFIKGVFWNDAHWAMGALVRHKHSEAGRLLKEMQASKLGRKHFARFLEAVAKGDKTALGNADSIVDGSDASAAAYKLPREGKRLLDHLLKSAREFSSIGEVAEPRKRRK